MAELPELLTLDELAELLEADVVDPLVQELGDLVEILEFQVNCQMVKDNVRAGYLYQAAGMSRIKIEQQLALLTLTITELDDQQFLITRRDPLVDPNAPENLAQLLGYYDSYEGPFDPEYGQFVAFDLIYPLKFADDLQVKRLQVQLFAYFVQNKDLEDVRFWKYLYSTFSKIGHFSQQYDYQIGLKVNDVPMLLSEVNRRLKLYTKFPAK